MFTCGVTVCSQVVGVFIHGECVNDQFICGWCEFTHGESVSTCGRGVCSHLL